MDSDVKTKLLFLTPQLPYPPVSGGVIKSHHLLAFLSAHYMLTLGCLLKNNDDLAQFKAIKPEIPTIALPLNIPRTGLNWLKSLIAGVPLTIYRNASESFETQLLSALSDCEVIFVDHYLMYQYVPKDFNGRVVVHQHNAEFMMWRRMAEQSSNLIKRLVIGYEAARICNYELSMCADADAVLAAPNDAAALIDAGARGVNFVDTYHLGDESALYLPELDFDLTELRLLYIGTLSWQANLDGLIWFLQQVWPLLLGKYPSLGFSIVGKCDQDIEKQLKALAPSIELLGFVDDLEQLYRSHRVYIAPLRFGSGIKVKVVNGLYRGIPTVTTDIGAEGLEVIDGEHLLIANEAQGFATHIMSVLSDRQLWQQLAQQSRQLMASRYTWQQVFAKVQQAIAINGRLENDDD